VVCARSRRFSPDTPLPGGAGPESLRWIADEYPGAKGQVCQNFEKIPLSVWWVEKFTEIYATIIINE